MTPDELKTLIRQQAAEIQRLQAENIEFRDALLKAQQRNAALENAKQDTAQRVNFILWAFNYVLEGFRRQEVELNLLRSLNRKIMQNAAARMDVQVINVTEFEADLRGD